MRSQSSPVHRLEIATAFKSLSDREKLYAHHMSRAAWHGTRIVLRQVSPEAIGIFDFILELYNTCSGEWSILAAKCGISPSDMAVFLEYAATFLSNFGNYYGSGDQKFVPGLPQDSLKALSTSSEKAENLFAEVSKL